MKTSIELYFELRVFSHLSSTDLFSICFVLYPTFRKDIHLLHSSKGVFSGKTDRQVSVTVTERRGLSPDVENNIYCELLILKNIQSRNIVEYIGAFFDKTR